MEPELDFVRANFKPRNVAVVFARGAAGRGGPAAGSPRPTGVPAASLPHAHHGHGHGSACGTSTARARPARGAEGRSRGERGAEGRGGWARGGGAGAGPRGRGRGGDDGQVRAAGRGRGRGWEQFTATRAASPRLQEGFPFLTLSPSGVEQTFLELLLVARGLAPRVTQGPKPRASSLRFRGFCTGFVAWQCDGRFWNACGGPVGSHPPRAQCGGRGCTWERNRSTGRNTM